MKLQYVRIIYCVTPNLYQIVKLLALALTNLVLSLVNLVTNLAKPSLGQPSY